MSEGDEGGVFAGLDPKERRQRTVRRLEEFREGYKKNVQQALENEKKKESEVNEELTEKAKEANNLMHRDAARMQREEHVRELAPEAAAALGIGAKVRLNPDMNVEYPKVRGVAEGFKNLRGDK